MSISLIGIMVGLPIALAMRSIMGKEKFEQWLKDTDYNLYTNFSGEDEMKKIVKMAGYDVVEWLGGLKTYFGANSSSYFLWKRENNIIIANMSIWDDKKEIEKFVNKVERVAGRKVFSENIDNQNSGILLEGKKELVSKQINNEKYKETFPSVYIDEVLIVKILERYYITILSQQKNQIVAEYENFKLIFKRNNDTEAFDIQVISDNRNMKKLYNCLESLTEEYYASLQERTYMNICEQLEEEGLIIEEEQIMDDNTIVLTVQI